MTGFTRRMALFALVSIGTALVGAPAAHALPQPTLVATTPPDGATAAATTEVKATYDVALDQTFSSITVEDETGLTIIGTTSFPDANTIQFHPTEALPEAGSPYTATATVRDLTKSYTTVTTWTFSVDTTAPARPAIQAVEGDTSSPALGNDPTPTVVVGSVTAGDTVRIFDTTAPGTAEEQTVELASKVVPAGANSVTFNAAESSADLTVSGDQDHTFTATATDPLGNVSTPSPSFVYTLETQAPMAPTISSVEGDDSSPAAGTDPTPIIVVSGVTAGDTVRISEGSTELDSKVVPAGATTVTFNATESDTEVTLDDGDNALTATATDPAGNRSPASGVFTYTLDATAPGAPTIASVEGDASSPAAGNDATPTVVVNEVTAGDTVTLKDGDAVLGSKAVPAGATTVTFNALESEAEVTLGSDGGHTLTAEATDASGHVSSASTPFVYHLDTGAVAPVRVSESPAAGSTVQSTNVVSATFDEPLAPGSTITVRNRAGNLVSGTTSFSADARTIIFTAGSSLTTAGSPYTATVVAEDVNNNSSTSSWTFSVDDTPPVAPTIASVEGDTTSPASGTDLTPTVTVSGVTAGDTVTLEEGATVLGSKVVPAGASSATFNAAESDSEVTVSGNVAHTLTATATDQVGNVSAASAGFVYTLEIQGQYRALVPARILDTRTGTGGSTAKIGPGQTREVQVTGQGGVPAAGVSAVVVNVTATEPTTASHLTAYPTGQPQPSTSNLNFVAGQTVPNLVMVKVGTGGRISVFNAAGSTHVIGDVQGWYTDPTAPVGTDGQYRALTPARILDTRTGVGAPAAKIGPGQTREVQVTGRGGVPATGVSAVVVNVTATEPTTASHLTAYPTGQPRPNTSNLNFVAGQSVPNLVVVKVGTGGEISVFNAAGSTHVIGDVQGWYTDSSATYTTEGQYRALTPARTLDTRTGVGAPAAKIGPGQTREVQVTGRGGVPATGVSAVVVNVTATEPTTASHLTAYPTGQPQPSTSNLNFVAGQTVPNLVVVKVGAGGKINLFNAAGSTHAIGDVQGWYTAP